MSPQPFAIGCAGWAPGGPSPHEGNAAEDVKRRLRLWCAGTAWPDLLDHIWQTSAASCLPLGSIWRRRASNSALERLHVWGSWGCIMLEGDISWVSLCVPMRPGKNSFVASFEFSNSTALGTLVALVVPARTHMRLRGSPMRD